jgi:hypothetical protein
MDELSRKTFDRILAKELSILTENDIAFLKARIDYLNSSQKEYYSSVFNKKVKEVVKPNLRRSRSYRELQKEASALGFHVVGESRENLERMLDTANGPK